LIPYYGPFGYRVGVSCVDHNVFRVKNGSIRMIMCNIRDSILFNHLDEDIEVAEEIIKEKILTQADKLAAFGVDSTSNEQSENFSPEEAAGTGSSCIIS
jgi:hypothetical protein